MCAERGLWRDLSRHRRELLRWDASGQDQLYALADRALYQAKRLGSNRIVTTSGTAHPGTPAAA